MVHKPPAWMQANAKVVLQFLLAGDAEGFVVYRFKFRDGHNYIGHTGKKNLPERFSSHYMSDGKLDERGGGEMNKALIQRLRHNEPCKFEILSSHASRDDAVDAEFAAIRAEPQPLNVSGAYGRSLAAEDVKRHRKQVTWPQYRESNLWAVYRIDVDGLAYIGSSSYVGAFNRIYAHCYAASTGNAVIIDAVAKGAKVKARIVGYAANKKDALRLEDAKMRKPERVLNARSNYSPPLKNSVIEEEIARRGLGQKVKKMAERKKKNTGARYARLKAERKCTSCGAPLAPSMRATTCVPCRERHKAKRHNLVARGLCQTCGEKNDNPRSKSCKSCRAEMNALRQQRWIERREAGLCGYCGEVPAQDGKVDCRACRKRQKASYDGTSAPKRKAERERSRKDGICAIHGCSRKATDGKNTCRKHRAYQNSYSEGWRTRRRDRGLCACGQPATEGMKSCADCRERDQERHKREYEERKDAGLCAKCGKKPSLADNIYCSSCKWKADNRGQRGQERREARAKLKAKTCPDCGKKLPKYRAVRCASCAKKHTRDTTRERKQARAAKLKAKGLCTKCGVRKAIPGRGGSGNRCQPCRDEMNAHSRKSRAKHFVQKLCVDCGDPVPPKKHKRCSACSAKRARELLVAGREQIKEERLALGMCYICAERKHLPGRTKCRKCMDASAASTRAYRERQRAKA